MSQFGIVSVWVYTARGALPIPDATVSISQRQPDGKHLLLALFVTDESGTTPPLTLPTPSAEESLSPGTETPFTLCDIRVEHPDFLHALVEDAQVFPDITTLQQVGLVPRAEHQDPETPPRVVLVPPQPL